MDRAVFRTPQFWIGIAVSAACLAALLLLIDPRAIGAALRTADYRYIAGGLLLMWLYMLLRAVRWRYMLENAIGVWHIFHLQNIGYMLTQILPLRLGDPVRAVLVGSVPPLTVGQGLSTMVVERLLDMLLIVVLLPFTLAEVPTLPAWMREGARASGVLAIAAIALVVLAANLRPLARRVLHAIFDRLPRVDAAAWVNRIDTLLAGLVTLTHWRSALTLALLSILPWLPMIAAYQLFMRTVGLEVGYALAGFVVCAAALSIAAPSSPGQVGVFHAGVTIAMTAAGLDSTSAASFAFLYHAVNFIFIIALGLIGLARTQATFGNVIALTRNTFGQRRPQSPPI